VLGYVARQKNIPLNDIDSLVEEAGKLDLAFEKKGELVSILLDGEDISAQLRTEEIGNMASKVAAIPEVRTALFERQKAFQQEPGLVADGRYMGTVVFPQADLKIYLTASQDRRAERRYKQLKDKGNDVSVPQLLTEISREIAERDERDSQRAVAPLKPADDAIVIDTSDLDIDEVEAKVMELVIARGFAVPD
jgi:cytidylate kinase